MKAGKMKMNEDDILESGNAIAAAIIIAASKIAVQLKYLGNGDAATPMGAIEAHSAHLGEKIDSLASALNEIAGAIDRIEFPAKEEE